MDYENRKSSKGEFWFCFEKTGMVKIREVEAPAVFLPNQLPMIEREKVSNNFLEETFFSQIFFSFLASA